MVKLTLIEEGLLVEVAIVLVVKEDLVFLGGLGEMVTFFLEMEGEVVDYFDRLD